MPRNYDIINVIDQKIVTGTGKLESNKNRYAPTYQSSVDTK